MMWVFLAIFSYFLNSVVAIADKFLLTRRVKNPLVYAFYVGVMSSIVFVLWPFCFSFLSFGTTLTAFAGGASFFLAIFFFYSALDRGGVVRATSIIGGLSPVLLLSLSYFFLKEEMPVFWVLSFLFLIAGGVLLAFTQTKENKSKFPVYSICAAVFFAITFFTRKVVFLDSSFLNGFIWVQAGVLFTILIVFLSPSFRILLNKSPLKLPNSLFLLVASNKTLSAVAFLVLNYAILLGPVAMINALQGVQYVFLFILTFIIYLWHPYFIKESFSRKSVFQKIIGIVLISLGVVFLVL